MTDRWTDILQEQVCTMQNIAKYLAHLVALISVLFALSQTPAYTARPRIRASASHTVPVYSPAFAGTHRACPQRDGQAELTWVAGYTLK